jgi:hypothetical protein
MSEHSMAEGRMEDSLPEVPVGGASEASVPGSVELPRVVVAATKAEVSGRGAATSPRRSHSCRR